MEFLQAIHYTLMITAIFPIAALVIMFLVIAIFEEDSIWGKVVFSYMALTVAYGWAHYFRGIPDSWPPF
jgi:hypothetical protein